jgi:hypothetical protein
MEEKMRSNKTAAEHVFFLDSEDEVWKLQGYGDDVNIYTAEDFVMYHKANDQAYLMNIPEGQEVLIFRLDDEQEFTIGFDHVTDTVYLDVDKEAFMNRESKEIFRQALLKDNESTDKE